MASYKGAWRPQEGAEAIGLPRHPAQGRGHSISPGMLYPLSPFSQCCLYACVGREAMIQGGQGKTC